MSFGVSYRPETIDDIILPSFFKFMIKGLVNGDRRMNTLLVGPPGIGKTTIANVWTKTFDRSLIINASDQRATCLTDDIRDFCQHRGDESRVVYLDECDNIMRKTQFLIVTLMDMFPNTTFLLTCNEHCKIIDHIKSRCLSLKCPTLSYNNIAEIIKRVLKRNKIPYRYKAILVIAMMANGDARTALHMTEYCYKLSGKVTKKAIKTFIPVPFETLMTLLVSAIDKRKSIDVLKCVTCLNDYGYTSKHISSYLASLSDKGIKTQMTLFKRETCGIRQERVSMMFLTKRILDIIC